jgi:hypothetical protein
MARKKKEKVPIVLENSKLEYKVCWIRNNKPKERKYKMKAWAERCFNFIAYGIVDHTRDKMRKYRYKDSYGHKDRVEIFSGIDHCVLQARYVGEWFPIDFETNFDDVVKKDIEF